MQSLAYQFGDILGQNNFFVLSLSDMFLVEGRQVPTPNTPPESTPDPNQNDFFDNPTIAGVVDSLADETGNDPTGTDGD